MSRLQDNFLIATGIVLWRGMPEYFSASCRLSISRLVLLPSAHPGVGIERRIGAVAPAVGHGNHAGLDIVTGRGHRGIRPWAEYTSIISPLVIPSAARSCECIKAGLVVPLLCNRLSSGPVEL